VKLTKLTRTPTARRRKVAILWGIEDVLRAGVLVLGGSLIVFIAWFRASSDAHYGDQIGMLDVSVVGVAVVCMGLVSWVLTGRRTIGERMQALLGRPLPLTTTKVVVVAGSVILEPATSDPVFASANAEPGGGLVAVDGNRLYHRPECPLVEGHDWPTASLEHHVAAGRTPCGICEP
jgi:hypothetical protein